MNAIVSTGRKLPAIVAVLMFAAGGASHAASITLFNTGVNAGGVAVPGTDIHYTITASPSGPMPAVAVTSPGFPTSPPGPWFINNAGSRWIGPDPSSQGPAGNYTYQTQFTLPANAVLSTATIFGFWGTDDWSANIFLNTVNNGNVSAGFTTLVPFAVTTGFQIGLNTLEFRLTNAGGPTGLRVDRIVGTYQVPEPATAGLASLALIATAGVVRRRKLSPATVDAIGCRLSAVRQKGRRALTAKLLLAKALLALTLLAGWLAADAAAHPLPGRDLLKFSQQPMDQTQVGGQIYWGHDELSTAYAPTGLVPISYRGVFMADDFADTLTTPVVHVKWWGSYLNNSQQFGTIKKFLIAFESDVPTPNPLGFSYPDPAGPIHSQIVTLGALSPSSGTFTETLTSFGGPPLNETLFEYNAELAIPFPQQAHTVHWLKIVALVDTAPGVNPLDPNAQIPRWGWHNRDYTQKNLLASPLVSPGENPQGPAANPIWHFQDDAVSGQLDVFTSINTAGLEVVQQVNQHLPTFKPENYVNNWDGPQGIAMFSKDLAFELYTVVPEPTSVVLMGVALAGVGMRRRRV